MAWQVFHHIESSVEDTEFTLRCSFMEASASWWWLMVENGATLHLYDIRYTILHL
jgi:hypothetical protein